MGRAMAELGHAKDTQAFACVGLRHHKACASRAEVARGDLSIEEDLATFELSSRKVASIREGREPLGTHDESLCELIR